MGRPRAPNRGRGPEPSTLARARAAVHLQPREGRVSNATFAPRGRRGVRALHTPVRNMRDMRNGAGRGRFGAALTRYLLRFEA